MEGFIDLKGVRVHNLKNIDLRLKLNKLIVITGVSGSGKSSLAFDTIYAEGQRRYVESLSSYARQFMGRLNKPEADYIKGLPPAIAIEQKVNTSNPRSTVGTSTEIYDYIKLLYAKAGDTYSPISGEIVSCDSVDSVSSIIIKNYCDKLVLIMAKIIVNDITGLRKYINKGFARIKLGDKILRIDDIEDLNSSEKGEIYLIIDRINVNEENLSRMRDSIEIAFTEGDGTIFINIDNNILTFSDKFEKDGIIFDKHSINTFNFNSPIGACPECNGYGKVLGIDEELVIPNKNLSIYEEAVACWKGEKMSEWRKYFIREAHKYNFPVHKKYIDLNEKEKEILWNGVENKLEGINDFFKHLEAKKHKIQNRVMIARYTGKTICPVCHGTRLKPEASYVKIGGLSITDIVDRPVSELELFFNSIKYPDNKKDIFDRILTDINSRIKFMNDIGLGYLTLNRLSSTLSGGESQRINLVTSLGSALVGSLYVLDEPSIGLHSRDTEKLISVLKHLRDLGNTVVVVEHDEDIIKTADEVIDIGPYAGRLGGKIVFQGDIKELNKSDCITADYLTGRRKIEIPIKRRISNKFIRIKGASANNINNLDIEIPLGIITAITGVSGSGKTTLIKSILIPAISRYLGDFSYNIIPNIQKLEGDLKSISKIEFIDQNPIGKSTRSNPATYIQAWDDIRKLFSRTKMAEIEGFKPSHFSFNIPGGRCEECQGEGIIKVEMQFMADLHIECETCKGKRFKDEVLEVKYKGKSIYDILEMTINQAFDFFSEGDSALERSIVNKIGKLIDVGMGYVKMGQSSSTLSGGESQRVKLAYFLSKESYESTLFVFDEPTTGLHFHDINKLMASFNSLIERNHTVLIIEHNMDVIKSVDNIIDLGPEGGAGGGNIIFTGTPEQIISCKKSYTGKYLKEKLI